ncbi:hypothetical protein TIFTF001_027371 [Ficus carica]|uniref:Uncharacterized protein n=1 Tax=Ficus carica TaxID=3494 RepID=A0AA88DMU4_FICCA|nr:hypothetical protein TIFTF001_027371 [Ficus carica]
MDATCPNIQVRGGHGCKSLVLAYEASTVSVRSSGGWWRRSRDKDKYSDRYLMLGVRWCRVVGVARHAMVRLSTGIEWHDTGSLGRPSGKELSSSRGSVALASIVEPDGDLREVPKGSVAQRRCWWGNLVTREGTPFTIATRLL